MLKFSFQCANSNALPAVAAAMEAAGLALAKVELVPGLLFTNDADANDEAHADANGTTTQTEAPPKNKGGRPRKDAAKTETSPTATTQPEPTVEEVAKANTESAKLDALTASTAQTALLAEAGKPLAPIETLDTLKARMREEAADDKRGMEWLMSVCQKHGAGRLSDLSADAMREALAQPVTAATASTGMLT